MHTHIRERKIFALLRGQKKEKGKKKHSSVKEAFLSQNRGSEAEGKKKMNPKKSSSHNE